MEAIPQIDEVSVQGGSALATAVTGNKKPIEIIVSGNDLEQIKAVALDFEENESREFVYRCYNHCRSG